MPIRLMQNPGPGCRYDDVRKFVPEVPRIPMVPEGNAAPGILKDVVRGERLELSRLTALPPQDSASTNFATRALRIGAGIYNNFARTRSDLCD